MTGKARRAAQWYAVITCACPKVHFVGFAPSEQEQPKWLPKQQSDPLQMQQAQHALYAGAD